MKKISIYITISAIALIASTSAQAGQHYISGALSHNKETDRDVEYTSGGIEYKVKGGSTTGKGLAMAYGYDFDSSLRLEGAFSIFEATEGFNNTKIESITASAFYDLDTGGKVTPYVGAGLGLAVLGEEEDVEYSYAVTPTVQFMAGTSLEVSKHIDLFAGLKYQHVGSTNFGDATDGSGIESIGYSDFGIKTFEMGARYAF
ncbi:MAG: opacity family porin [Alphaproteobacteria bacterium]